MKTKFYSFAGVAILFFFSQTLQAQQLLPGNFSGAVENLLAVRYRNVRNVNATQPLANFTGIHDLGSNRSYSSNNTRVDQNMNYTDEGSYKFTIRYNPALNSFVCVTSIGTAEYTNTLPGIAGVLAADGKSSAATSINYLALAVRTQNSTSTIRVNGLKLNGVSLTGDYERSNNNGESNWYIVTSSLSNGFVLTGTVTLSGSFANSPDGQRVDFSFGSTPQLGGPLPVTWGAFTAKRMNSSTASVNWETLQEINTSHFDVERSEDGVRFSKIGTTQAVGSSNNSVKYSFEDNNATGSLYYYRIAQYDADGRKSFSSIARVGNNNKQTLTGMFGNTIRIQFFENGTKQMRVLNMNGSVVKQLNTSGMQSEISIDGMPSGVYILQITDSKNQKEVVRFVK
jgi:Secretion system C-terminal sorting domain